MLGNLSIKKGWVAHKLSKTLTLKDIPTVKTLTKKEERKKFKEKPILFGNHFVFENVIYFLLISYIDLRLKYNS